MTEHSRRSETGPTVEGLPTRNDRDIFRLAPSMDAETLQTIAARLEFRGTDDGYARLSQAYFTRLPLAEAQRMLALGCGTGIEVRALKRLSGPSTTITGIDHSTALIDTARRLTTDEGLGENVSYDVGDAHHTPYDDDEFDIVTLHTVISHVDDPLQVLLEARRIVRPGGTVAIFDGDDASLTFAYPDHLMAKTIEEKLIQLIVANPRIMRDMPRLVADAGLELVDAEGVALRQHRQRRLLVGRCRVLRPTPLPLRTPDPGDRRRVARLPGPILRRQHLLRRVQLLHLLDAATHRSRGLGFSLRALLRAGIGRCVRVPRMVLVCLSDAGASACFVERDLRRRQQ